MTYQSNPGNNPAPEGIQTAPPVRIAVQLPSHKPIACYTLIGITVIGYLLQLAAGYLLPEVAVGVDIFSFLFMKINTLIAQGQYWRLITPMFLHGSVLHIAFNMYGAYIIGQGLERFYGHKRFLMLYFISGIAGNVLSYFLSASASLGASTAVFGLLAAQGIFIYKNRMLFGKESQRMITNIILVATINLLMGLTPGIDLWGHAGGLIGGIVFAWLGGPVLFVQQLGEGYRLTDRRTDRQALLYFAVGLVLLLILTIMRPFLLPL